VIAQLGDLARSGLATSRHFSRGICRSIRYPDFVPILA